MNTEIRYKNVNSTNMRTAKLQYYFMQCDLKHVVHISSYLRIIKEDKMPTETRDTIKLCKISNNLANIDLFSSNR